MPVCPENGVQTFFSPCYAGNYFFFLEVENFKLHFTGCGAEILINEVRMFGNCSCGVDINEPQADSIATDGACGMSDCKPYYIAFQGLVIVAAALIASTLVGKLIIAIRAVLPQDKALAISIELFFVGIIVYIPGKLGYAFLARK